MFAVSDGAVGHWWATAPQRVGRSAPEEFRRQAVDFYESTPGATVRGVAEDLGIVRGTLRGWLEVYGTGKKTAADGTSTSSPLQSMPSRRGPVAPAGETPEQ
jgi:transposase